MNTLIATEKSIPLAPLTTLELGGPAAQFIRVTSVQQALEVVRAWLGQPPEERPPLLPLGGGSNLVVSDAGFPGLVLKMENDELELLQESPDQVLVRVGAGLNWDQFVATATVREWAGIECLSGIPGSVGASPVQNIGAYGQEVSETIKGVEGVDLESGQLFRLAAPECEFSYRDSLFKRHPGRYLITAVTFGLRPQGAPTVRYQELKERLEADRSVTLAQVRETVIAIRRSKSMVYDKNDPNHRSAGSFFTNPVVSQKVAERLQASLGPDAAMPCYPAGSGKVKLSAAWLITQSGLPKGFKLSSDARAGLSTNHSLALTNRGGATTGDLLALCRHVQEVVRKRFGVALEPEPVFVGF